MRTLNLHYQVYSNLFVYDENAEVVKE